MPLDPEEVLELLEMHGRTIIESCVCDDCQVPMKEAMLKKLDRMRELIAMLPDHNDIEFEPEERTVQ